MQKVSGKVCLFFGVVLMVSTVYAVWGDVSGFAAVLVCLGSVFLLAVPFLVWEVADEVYRAVWQSWRIAGWQNLPGVIAQTRARGYACPEMSRVRRAWRFFRHDFFSSYTTITVAGRTFHRDPRLEAAYFAKAEAEEDAYLASIGATP